MVVIRQMNNKVAIFSDIHLGVHQNSDFWLDVSGKWVDWFVNDLLNKGITDIIFCGDWMHYRDAVEVKTLHCHSTIIEKFENFNVYMIPGNHCCYYKNNADVHSLSIMKGFPNVVVFDKVSTLQVENKELTFCPWGTAINDIPKSDILFGHFELQNFRMNSHKICEHGDDPDILLNKAPLVFSGHFHQRDEKVFEDAGTIVYVGNPFQMDFGDAYQRKGYYILDIATSKYEFIENDDTPKHLKIVLSELIKIDPTPIICKEALSGNIIKMVIDKNISTEHLDLIVTKFSMFSPADVRIDYDVNYNKINVSSDADIIGAGGFEIESVINEFVEMLSIENKKEVIEYTLSLYNRAAE